MILVLTNVGGSVSYARYLLIFGLFCLFLGCVSTGGKDAIAVWQHQGSTWDVWYSVWDHDAKAWNVPGGGQSAPIAEDAGDDYDPDVSSNDNSAIAVWTKQTGGNTIYYSVWENENWTAPAKVSSDDQDTDPTVAMDGQGNALAVWVSQGRYLYSSYYTKGSWSTPEKLNTSGIGFVSMPELAYSAGYYYLVFTGKNSTATNAYVSSYSSSWTSPIMVGKDAVLDNKVPTDQRTGITAQANKVTAVWPGENGVYSVELGKGSKQFADGQMPDTAYDSGTVANGAYNENEDLLHQPNVNSPGTTSFISGMKESDDRPSLTFIRDKRIGLVVWWTEVLGPGQIYYSYNEGTWAGPAEIDPSSGDSYDRNPAVSPLVKIIDKEVGPYCGDTFINQPWEQCEVGVACPNPNDWCNVANCQCIPRDYPPPPNESIDCSINTMAGKVGLSIWKPGMACADDCAAVYGKQYTCDPSCSCIKKKQPTNISCTANSGLFGPAVTPKAGDICTDDCKKVLGNEYDCNTKDCVCEKRALPPPPQNISCAINSLGEILGGSGFKAGDICTDDCETIYGSDYECDMKTCVCEEKPVPTKTCAGHTQEVIRTDKNDFDPSTMKCEDNCEKLGQDYECNLESCTCTRPYKEEVSCYGNSISSMLEAFGISNASFDASKQRCVDDCAEVLDSFDAVCDVEKCTCDYKMTCAGNTEDTANYGSNIFEGGQCIDNCEKLGPGFKCNMESCLCRPEPGDKVYCAAHTDDGYVTSATGEGVTPFDPSTQQCIDNCKEIYPEGYTCDVESCYCVPKEVQDVSCVSNTYHVDATDKNVFNPSSQKCEDDCEELGDYECNVESCTCTKKKYEFSCLGNSIDFSSIFGSSDVKYDPSKDSCVDDCGSIGVIGVGDLECDTQACICKPVTTCAGNTLDSIDYGSNIYGSDYGICKDNCEKLGPGLVCDLKSCLCRQKPGEPVYCAANTDEAYLDDSLGQTHERFDPSKQVCKDNCKEIYGPGAACDMSSCYCVPGEGIGNLSCSENTDLVTATDVNSFDASKMQCLDDCAEYYGSDYECYASSCTCAKKSKPEVSCSERDPAATTTERLSEKYPDGYICKDDCDEGYECDSEACVCIPETTPVCGDGVITGTEECDWASASTNKCESSGENYPYCTESCQCKELETSQRCGDGKITGVEECDGGNVKTNICPEGYKCYTPECVCQVEEGSGQCGDGTVTPPEECDHGNSYTEKCPDGKICYSCQCLYSEDIPEEAYCGNNKKEGSEECDGTDDSACSSNEYCSYCQCVEEPTEGYCGDGVVTSPEQCESNKDCSENEYCSGCKCKEKTTITLYCGDGVITQELGEQCESSGDCNEDAGEICSSCRCLAPPVLNCPSVCSSAGYSIVVPGTYGSASACYDEASEGTETCKVKCIYSYFYKTSNAAGTAECCCKEKYVEDCPRTATGGCICPEKSQVDTVICPAHAP